VLPKRKLVLGNSITRGDVIIGIKSSGLHSNGYSLARKVLLSKYSIKDKIRGVGRLGNVLLTPTQIYVKPVLEVIKKCKVHGLAHITGGAFTKLLRLKKIGYDLFNMPQVPPIMQLIEDKGVKEDEMYKTFNMGIGFCIVVSKDEVNDIESIIKKHKMSSQHIGNIVSKTGVFVNSKRIA
ncbi:MAG: AIR synthase-related protein, partial [Nitrosopumilaceae archaeon]|nr:AIR synthase-related protein [Nitrosopumilaceae archaeon]